MDDKKIEALTYCKEMAYDTNYTTTPRKELLRIDKDMINYKNKTLHEYLLIRREEELLRHKNIVMKYIQKL